MKPVYLPVALAVLAALLLIVAGPGARLEWWEFRSGFFLMRLALFGGLGAAALAALMLAVGRLRRQGKASLVVALVLGLAVAYVPWAGVQRARSVPPIHDITTDTARPPQFVAVLPLRASASNPSDYGGPDVARSQLEAYPDVRPLVLDADPTAALARAEKAARDLGWEIVAMDAEQGRMEATDTTFWFGFKDDVVVRVEPSGAGSRIDVRSVSRVGASDVGANASRIRRLLARIEAAE
ncbi:MAG: DUF1499 domain-containing protein [Pseudomonadota bacterium]|nr:DUF1499 domain-containing protein [Pseudomonadota bacterium]